MNQYHECNFMNSFWFESLIFYLDMLNDLMILTSHLHSHLPINTHRLLYKTVDRPQTHPVWIVSSSLEIYKHSFLRNSFFRKFSKFNKLSFYISVQKKVHSRWRYKLLTCQFRNCCILQDSPHTEMFFEIIQFSVTHRIKLHETLAVLIQLTMQLCFIEVNCKIAKHYGIQ